MAPRTRPRARGRQGRRCAAPASSPTTSSSRRTGPASADDGDLSLVFDLPVELAVEIGRTTMTIRETLAIAPGLDRSARPHGRRAGRPARERPPHRPRRGRRDRRGVRAARDRDRLAAGRRGELEARCRIGRGGRSRCGAWPSRRPRSGLRLRLSCEPSHPRLACNGLARVDPHQAPKAPERETDVRQPGSDAAPERLSHIERAKRRRSWSARRGASCGRTRGSERRATR